MVRYEFALPCQSHTIDAVRLKGKDCEVSTHAYYHQRHEKVVACRQLRYEEHPRQRRVHHARHHARHSQQRGILLGKNWSYIVNIPQPCEEETRESPDKQGWRERTAASSSAVGAGGGEAFGKDYARHVKQKHIRSAAIEHGIFHYPAPVSLRSAAKQYVYGRIALAIEGRKEEYQRAEYYASECQLCVWAAHFAEDSLAGCHHPYKIQRHHSAEHSQQYV